MLPSADVTYVAAYTFILRNERGGCQRDFTCYAFCFAIPPRESGTGRPDRVSSSSIPSLHRNSHLNQQLALFVRQ